MRVVMLSKALVVGAYQKKAEELARRPGVDLTVIVPPYWNEAGRRQLLETTYTAGYRLIVRPMLFNGHFHVHLYPGLYGLFRKLRPDVVHVDEEPYNLATLHAMWAARRAGAKTVFFTWQNLYRPLPLPFAFVERYCLGRADYALAGNQEAVTVLRRKGYRGSVVVLPQFGIDPALYAPRPKPAARPFTIGFLGRLVEQKGLAMLLEAVAGLDGDWRLLLVGSGPYQPQLESRSTSLGLSDRVLFRPAVPSIRVPAVMAELDVLVLPSLTCSNWKEQFGRVLIEAMACEVPVVGSDSGEIPNVIGEAGLVFPEGDAPALRACLARLRDDEVLRSRLVVLGRTRVLDNYTQASIAAGTHQVYERVVRNARRP